MLQKYSDKNELKPKAISLANNVNSKVQSPVKMSEYQKRIQEKYEEILARGEDDFTSEDEKPRRKKKI